MDLATHGVFGWVHRIALDRMGDFGRSETGHTDPLNAFPHIPPPNTDIVQTGWSVKQKYTDILDTYN